MHGDVTLGLGSTLSDYAEFIPAHPHAFHVTVVSANAPSPTSVPVPHLSPSTESPGFYNNPAGAQPGVIAASSLVRPRFTTPPSSANEPSFLILVVFEDGSTMAPVVSASTTVRRFCQQVGNFANVSSDIHSGLTLCWLRFGSDAPHVRFTSDPSWGPGTRFLLARSSSEICRALDARWLAPASQPSSSDACAIWTAASSWLWADPSC